MKANTESSKPETQPLNTPSEDLGLPTEGDATEHLTIRGAMLRWAVCALSLLTVWGLIGKLDTDWGGFIFFVGYPAIGYYLNRSVLARLVEWHPYWNTLGNVSSAKLKFFIAWPVQYPKLFFSLLVKKFL
jgi:ABC-type branched-subunit amino acid transport system permease subunit